MTFVFQQATQQAEKARIVLDGLPGAGVTPAALRIARGLAGPGGVIGVVDTQRGAALRYAADHDFLHLPVDSFSPADMPAITAAALAAQVDVLIVDTFTSFWSGKDGMLNLVDRHRKSATQSGWAEARPVEQDMMDALLGYPGHVIVTLRVRSDIAVGSDEQGNPTPIKVALKPESRDGLEYDFHLAASLDLSGALTVTSTCAHDVSELAVGAAHRKPGEEFGELLAGWLDQGAVLPTLRDYRDRALDPSTSSADLRAMWTEIEQRGMSGLTVQDGAGKTGPLVSLVAAMGRAATAREKEQAAQLAATAPARPDDKQFVAAVTLLVAESQDEITLNGLEADLEAAHARAECSDDDKRTLRRVIEQRRYDLGIPHGQPRTPLKEATA